MFGVILILYCDSYISFNPEVDEFVHSAFLHHGESALIRSFLDNARRFSQHELYRDGLTIGSMCTGWGVAEMVINSLNRKLREVMEVRPFQATHDNPKVFRLWSFNFFRSKIASSCG